MKRQISITLSMVTLLAVLLGTVNLAGAAPLARPLQQSGAPTVVSYQGQVTVGGTPWNTPGYFKFAIVDSATGDGATNYWANDSTASGEPATPVSLDVNNGLFNVLLGDTSMTALPATAFDGTERYLRVWFSRATGGPAYTYADETAAPGIAYTYWLEAVDLGGAATRYGPVSATRPAPALRTIYLPLVLR